MALNPPDEKVPERKKRVVGRPLALVEPRRVTPVLSNTVASIVKSPASHSTTVLVAAAVIAALMSAESLPSGRVAAMLDRVGIPPTTPT